MTVQAAALRAAAQGLSAVEVIETCQHVDSRTFDIAIMASAAYQQACKSGRIPPPLQPKEIVDGSTIVMGSTDPVEAHPIKKLMAVMTVSHMEPPGPDTSDRAKAHVISAIKGHVKSGQLLKDVVVMSTGRIDQAVAFGAALAAAVPVDGGADAIFTSSGSLVDGAVSCWGDIKLAFWVTDA